MHPVIFELGPFTLRSFGLAFAVGFAVAIAVVLRRAKRWGFPPDPVLSLCLYLIFAGILGARLAYVVTHVEEFSGRWLDAFNPFAGEQFGLAGLNLYGGIVAGLLFALWYSRRRNLPVLGVLDLLTPGVGVGMFVARWGCFFNGCCFGTPTDLPWGVSFPPDTLPYYVYGPAHLHPSQIYSSLYGLALFGFTIFVDNRKKYFGWTLAWFLIVEALFRVVIERVRYYEPAMHFWLLGRDFTYNELMSALLFATGIFLLVFLPRYGEKAEFLKLTFGRS